MRVLVDTAVSRAWTCRHNTLPGSHCCPRNIHDKACNAVTLKLFAGRLRFADAVFDSLVAIVKPPMLIRTLRRIPSKEIDLS